MTSAQLTKMSWHLEAVGNSWKLRPVLAWSNGETFDDDIHGGSAPSVAVYFAAYKFWSIVRDRHSGSFELDITEPFGKKIKNLLGNSSRKKQGSGTRWVRQAFGKHPNSPSKTRLHQLMGHDVNVLRLNQNICCSASEIRISCNGKDLESREEFEHFFQQFDYGVSLIDELSAILFDAEIPAPYNDTSDPVTPSDGANSTDHKVASDDSPQRGLVVNRTSMPTLHDRELFVARAKYQELLDSTLKSDSTLLLTLHGQGGTGKSTIVDEWFTGLGRQSTREKPANQIFAYSFPNQSQLPENLVVRGVDFLQQLQRHLANLAPELDVESNTNQYLSDQNEWARSIAQTFLRTGGVVVLDGLEPLCRAPENHHIGIKDDAISVFIDTCLSSSASQHANSLIVVTAHYPLKILQSYEDQSQQVAVQLEESEGLRILKHYLRGDSQSWSDEQCSRVLEVVREPLWISIFASIVRANATISVDHAIEVFLTEAGGGDYNARAHEDRLCQSLYECVENKSPGSLLVLKLTGLFSVVPSLAVLHGLWDECVLKSQIPRGAKWDRALTTLAEEFNIGRSENLLLVHPRIQRYFGGRFQEENRELYRDLHSWIFERFFVTEPEPNVNDLGRLIGWLEAIGHGCTAGRYADALERYRHLQNDSNFQGLPERFSFSGQVVACLHHFSFWTPQDESADSQLQQVLSDQDRMFIHSQIAVHSEAAFGFASTITREAYLETLRHAIQLDSNDELFNCWYLLARSYNVETNFVDSEKYLSKMESVLTTGDYERRLKWLSRKMSMLFFRGKFTEAFRCSELAMQAIEDRFRKKNQKPHAAEVACMASAARICWHVGKWESAVAAANQAVEMSIETQDAKTIAMARYYAFRVDTYMVRNLTEANEHFRVLCDVSERNGLAHWMRLLDMLRGYIETTIHGDMDKAIRLIEYSMNSYARTGAKLGLTNSHCYLAAANFEKGDLEAADQHIKKGIQLSREGKNGRGEEYFRSELCRWQSSVFQANAARGDDSLASKAEASMYNAIDTAAEQGTQSLRLRWCVAYAKSFQFGSSAKSVKNHFSSAIQAIEPGEFGAELSEAIEVYEEFSRTLGNKP
ncbi:MAG: tetratricopeptide repeat protein [Rubripirellula sp.]